MFGSDGEPAANVGKLKEIRVQLGPPNGVSLGVRRFGWILTVGLAVAGSSLLLAGCGAASAVEQQVRHETFAPQKPTVQGVVVHVYLDRSGSAKPLREDISKQVLELLDTFPDGLETTLYWYSQECIKIGSTVSSLPNLTPFMKDYVKDDSGDDKGTKGTYLATAFRDLETQATRDSGKQVIGVFVSDGGFEDDQSVLAKETEVLRDMPNVTMLVFVGLDADGTQKLTVLDNVVRDKFIGGNAGDAQKQFFDVTLKNGGTKLEQAKEAIAGQIAANKQN
ncbi:MAG: VWA domain-containing protein [Armatimonadetes bacterium]|nr:VWA domain-containing protein [Armatimonadota bacterium]MBS1711425.1 VWA domain-containing protein [Armatimonadota bacterium]MBX3107650.1 VWA domain-containing protein [Fimbriimonadaceae bacterium]